MSLTRPVSVAAALFGAIDRRAAVIWGEIMGDGDRAGQPKPMADAQIAAVALAQDLTLVTRNVEDFAGTGVSLLNPWAPGPGSRR